MAATETDQEKQVVRIWDDPESRIHFLETILKGKEWNAVIYHPDFAPDGTQRKGTSTPLPELSQKLALEGYKVSLGEDENGIPVLNVRNFGSDTSLSQTIRELGFAKGMTHKLTHINEPLGNAMQKTADMVKHVASDKARLIGGLYMIGDLFLIFAGLGNGKKKDENDNTPEDPKRKSLRQAVASFRDSMQDPANRLQSAAGIAATLQSLIYMGFAKEGSEAMYSELMTRAKDARENGKDLLDPSVWQDKEPTGPKGLLGLPHKMLKNYPLQLGALTQVGGQLCLMASGGIRFQRNKGGIGEDAGKARQGAVQDMLTATSSIIGWSLLTKTKPKKIAEEDKYPWSDPRRVWQEMSEKPNQFASGFLSAATLSGIAAGRAKDNSIQTMGNLTYLLGDGIMFMTKSDHYGAAGMGNSGMLAEAAEHFVKASPIILGAKEQAQFVNQLSTHLAERSLHDEAKKQKRSGEIPQQEIDALSARIASGLNAKLPAVNEHANAAAARIAGVVKTFHPMVGEKITDALCDAVCQMQGVSIDKEELKSHVVRQTEYAKDTPTQLVKMSDIAQPMADLLFAIPGAANPEAVNKLYDAVDEYIRPEPLKQQERAVEESVNNTAMRDIATASHKGQAQDNTQPSVGAHTAALAAARQNGQSANLNR